MNCNVIALRRAVIVGLVCFTVLCAASSQLNAQQASDVKSQPAATQPAVDFSKLTQSLVDEKIKQAQAISDEAVRTEVIAIYEKTTALLKQAETWSSRQEEFKKQRLGAPAQIEKIKASMQEPISKVEVEVDSNRTLSQMEQNLAKLQAELDEVNKQKSQLDIAIKEQMARRTQIPELSAKASQCSVDATRELNAAGVSATAANLNEDV